MREESEFVDLNSDVLELVLIEFIIDVNPGGGDCCCCSKPISWSWGNKRGPSP